MNAAIAPSLDTQVEESLSLEVVTKAENDASYIPESDITVWIFDPSICG